VTATGWREHPTVLVASREITEGFRSRGTKIMLALSAVAVIAIVVIARLASDSGGSTTDLVVVGAPDSSELAAFEALGDAAGTRIEATAADTDAAARAAVSDGDADVALLADGEALLTEEPVEPGDDSATARVVTLLRAQLAFDEALAGAGLSPAEIAEVRANPGPELRSTDPGDGDETDDRGAGLAIVMNILLFLLLQTYGGWVVQGVTREKASRVVEVLLSAVTPRQLLFGKIAGIGIVALANAAVLVVVGLVATRVAGVEVLEAVRARDVLIGGVWFLLGYALYCSAFAVAGALCSRAEDAQSALMPIMLPMIAGYIAGFTALGGANTVVWVLAFIPPTAVMCMPVLAALGAAPVWAVLLSMALTLAAALAVALLAVKIYERSILRAGRRIKWLEALRLRSAPT